MTTSTNGEGREGPKLLWASCRHHDRHHDQSSVGRGETERKRAAGPKNRRISKSVKKTATCPRNLQQLSQDIIQFSLLNTSVQHTSHFVLIRGMDRLSV